MGFWSRLARTIRPGRHDAEIDEEIAFHLEMKRRDGADARSARLRFGNPHAIREDVRAAGMIVLLESILQDVRYGLRQLRRTPLLTAAVVASIVVGIGANAAIFSLVDAALLRGLPVRDPGRLVVIEWVAAGWPEGLLAGHTGNTSGSPEGPLRASSVSPALYRQLVAEQDSFAALIGVSDGNAASLAAGGRAADQVNLQFVSDHFFQELGAPPVRGRAFSTGDDRVGADPVVIISHRYWQSAFAGQDDVLGASVRVNGVTASVVGVAPPGFFGVEIGEWVDLYAPLAARVVLMPSGEATAARAEDPRHWWVRQFGRLAPGDTAEAATGRLSALFRARAVPEGTSIDAARIPSLVWSPGRRGFDPVSGDTAAVFWALLLLVGLVLLIVCANVANLLLARSVARRRESAVRLALGAGRGRLIRQSLIESGLLAAIGAVAGLAAGRLLAEGIHSALVAGYPTRGLDVGVDWRVASYTAAIAALSAMFFGLAPALRQTRTAPNDTLKAGSRTIASGHLRLPRLLVASQIALCLTVLVSAGLLGRSLTNLRQVDLGFARDNLLYVSVNPWRAGMPAEHVEPYVARLREELARLPGVRSVGTVASRPLSGSSSAGSVNIPGRPYREDGSDHVMVNELGDGALAVLGIPLIAGRPLAARDMLPGADAVLVDELFVQRFFPDRYPLGQRFGFGREQNDQFEIVGLVRSSRYNSLRTDLRPTFYRPHRPAGRQGRDIHVALRTEVDAAQLAPAIRRAAAAANPDVGVAELFTQTELVDRLLYAERLMGAASTAFGGVALLLAGIGLSGLLGYAVARRTNEIGVRMAMGATPSEVQRLVQLDALKLAALGTVIGVPCAWLTTRMLQSMLFGVSATDLWTSAASFALLLTVAGLAAWLPARRAARINPVMALRDD